MPGPLRHTRPPSSTVHPAFIVRLVLSTVALTGVVACSNPAGPTPPPSAAPAIVCPTDIKSSIAEGSTATVTYVLPQATGGSAPVSVACVQPSGSTFGLGTTDVTCTATDSASRVGQCAFRVSVAVAPRLKGTKILAFGDSITAGVVSPAAVSRVRSAGIAGSYPYILQERLTARYSAQTIEVINEGWPGEKVTETGEDRLEDVVERYRPDVVIVLEGVNDLSTKTPRVVSETLKLGVRRVIRANVPLVFVSTILPGVEGRIKPPSPLLVNELNDEIRSWAAVERAVLLDTYSAMEPSKQLLIGQDGLHPTPAGYEFMASIFFEAIKNHFEVPGAAAPASSFDPRWPFAAR